MLVLCRLCLGGVPLLNSRVGLNPWALTEAQATICRALCLCRVVGWVDVVVGG